MRATVLLTLISLAFCGFAQNQAPSGKYITKKRLAYMIDSLLDLQDVQAADIELMNYYASLLKKNGCDSAMVCHNLSELSFYSLKDETLLFPPVSLDKLPASQNILIESGFLSYFKMPFAGVVTSHFGWREGKMHKGTDIDLVKGDKVVAAFSGKVRVARKQGGYGNVVILMHPNGLETLYAHLSKIKVKTGDVVLSGQTIGLGGNTGHSSGSHLHFEVRYLGHPINPASIISFSDKKLYHHTITVRCQSKNVCAFPSNSSMHKVNRGESWYTIANRYGLSLKQLMALNGVSKRSVLKAGTVLRVN